MSRAVAIGDELRLAGYALGGAEVLGADAEAAWDALGDEVALVVLTPDAFAALQARLGEHDVLWAVLPE